MADMFIDRMVKKECLKWISDYDSEPDAKKHLLNSWKAMTRVMFWNYPVIEVYGLVEECMLEANDQQYWDNKIVERSAREVPILEKKIIKTKGKTRQLIDANLKITDVAVKYGLKVRSNKCVCPFHNDTDPSLSFNNKKNVFFCFGCGAKGDIIEFIIKMEELNGTKRSN